MHRAAIASFKVPGGTTRPSIAALLGLAAVMASTSAFADGNSAKANLQANLRRAGMTAPDLNAPGITVLPALVKGMYGI